MGSLRLLSVAAVIGTSLALVADVLLQSALSLVRVDGGGYGWLLATALERGRWVVVAALLWIAAPAIEGAVLDESRAGSPGARLSRRTAFRAAGIAMIAAPVAWAVATLSLRALNITLGGDWPYEGRVFLTPYFYSSLLVSYAPWALAGAAVLGLARHAPAD